MDQPESSNTAHRWLLVPPGQLSDDALQGLLQEYISREGTDYGNIEVPFAQQLQNALTAVQAGDCVIVFDRQLESCQLLSREQAAELFEGDG